MLLQLSSSRPARAQTLHLVPRQSKCGRWRPPVNAPGQDLPTDKAPPAPCTKPRLPLIYTNELFPRVGVASSNANNPHRLVAIMLPLVIQKDHSPLRVLVCHRLPLLPKRFLLIRLISLAPSERPKQSSSAQHQVLSSDVALAPEENTSARPPPPSLSLRPPHRGFCKNPHGDFAHESSNSSSGASATSLLST